MMVTHSTKKTPSTPWQNQNEFNQLASALVNNLNKVPSWILQRLGTWCLRCNPPSSVVSTYHLLIVLSHPRDETDSEIMRLALSMAIVRMVNGTTDSAEPGINKSAFSNKKKIKTKAKSSAKSVLQRAASIGLPRDFVRLRHIATHSELPSLPALLMAGWRALGFLVESYWLPSLHEDHNLKARHMPAIYQQGLKLLVEELSALTLPPPQKFEKLGAEWGRQVKKNVPCLRDCIKLLLETKHTFMNQLKEVIERFIFSYLMMNFDPVENPVCFLVVLELIFHSEHESVSLSLRLISWILNFLLQRGNEILERDGDVWNSLFSLEKREKSYLPREIHTLQIQLLNWLRLLAGLGVVTSSDTSLWYDVVEQEETCIFSGTLILVVENLQEQTSSEEEEEEEDDVYVVVSEDEDKEISSPSTLVRESSTTYRIFSGMTRTVNDIFLRQLYLATPDTLNVIDKISLSPPIKEEEEEEEKKKTDKDFCMLDLTGSNSEVFYFEDTARGHLSLCVHGIKNMFQQIKSRNRTTNTPTTSSPIEPLVHPYTSPGDVWSPDDLSVVQEAGKKRVEKDLKELLEI